MRTENGTILCNCCKKMIQEEGKVSQAGNRRNDAAPVSVAYVADDQIQRKQSDD